MEIDMLPPEPDATTVTRLADIVNAAYEEGEKGLWRTGAARTSVAELVELAGQGQLAVAREQEQIIGCVRLQQLNVTTGELGLLAADPASRGNGVGRELVRFAEHRMRSQGLSVMQLELLAPLDGEHPFKEFLRGWYTRLGYRQVGAAPLAGNFPALAPLLAVPCQLLIFQKNLR